MMTVLETLDLLLSISLHDDFHKPLTRESGIADSSAYIYVFFWKKVVLWIWSMKMFCVDG